MHHILVTVKMLNTAYFTVVVCCNFGNRVSQGSHLVWIFFILLGISGILWWMFGGRRIRSEVGLLCYFDLLVESCYGCECETCHMCRIDDLMSGDKEDWPIH